MDQTDSSLLVASTSSGPPAERNDADPGSLLHARAYRSRRNRPCDRCRSRKARCVVLVDGVRCLNCELSSSECQFLRPAAQEPREPRAAKTKARHVQGDEAEVGLNYREQDQETLPPAVPSLPTSSFPAALHSRPQDPPAPPFTPQDISTIYTNPGPPPVTRRIRAGVTDIISAVRLASSTAFSFQQLHRVVQDWGALDLEAGEEDELYLVGTVAERDALMLSLLVPAGHAPPAPPNPAPGIRIRHVSTDPSNPAAFVFYRTKPYEERAASTSAFEELVLLVGQESVAMLMQTYLRIDGHAQPIWSAEHFQANPNVDPGLQCAYITTGLIHHNHLRPLYQRAWAITHDYFRVRSPRARLSTIQSALVDLNGRASVDPAGNFVRLGTTIAVARLLGLHKNCDGWTIPLWERDLRTRLWWSLLQYDKISALTFGRSSMIGSEDREVPLPRRSPSDTPSYSAFVSLCELVLILDDFNTSQSSSKPPHSQLAGINPQLTRLSDLGLRLDDWRNSLDGLFDAASAEAHPGVRSLQLLYYFGVLVFSRAAWDAVALEDPVVVSAGQRACLQAATDLVEFVESLTLPDLLGYWSSHSPFILSTCLTSLVRLTLQSDRTDQSDSAVWQGAVYSLRRLISALGDARSSADWDVADLTLARAHYFVPILAKHAAEFDVVLQPLQKKLLDPPMDEALEDFLNTFVVDPYGGLFDGVSNGYSSSP